MKLLLQKKGFTLIEILIVIAIISIIAAIVMVAINPSRRFEQTLDATKKVHINTIKDAIRYYQLDNKGHYPECIPSYDEIVSISECEKYLVPNFISKIPENPTVGENYVIGYEDEKEQRIKVYSTIIEPNDEPQAPSLPIVNGLVLRLDASTIIGINDGNTISTWPDSSGSGNNAFQSEENRKPIYKSNTLNNKPAINFDGTKSLIVQNSTSLEITPHITIMAVVKPKITDGGHRRIVIKGHTSWSEPYYYYSLWSNSNNLGFGVNINNSRRWDTYSGGISANNSYVLTGRYNGSQQNWYVNGMLIGTKNQTGNMSINNQPLRIGSTQASPGNTWFSGDIAEILIYNFALPDNTRSEVEQYLIKKWLN